MKPETEKIERHQQIERYGVWLLGELQKEGILFSVTNENALSVKGEMLPAIRELIRLNKRHLIDALSPKCAVCTLPMTLIENGKTWFCSMGCGSFPV